MFKHLIATVLAVFALNSFAAVDANRASQAELETVKGIGPGLSTKIMDARKTGEFKNWDDLVDRVGGVGPKNATRFSQAGLTVAGAAFANNSLNLQNAACDVAGAQSWISDTCGWLGLGARPTREERMAWERLPPGDCTALRQHAKQFPKGAYASTATAMYNAPTVTGSESWIAATFPLRLLVSRDVDASPTEVAARAAAIDRGRKKAEMMCRDGADTKLVRFRSAEVDAQEWKCDEVRGGHVCGFEGRALCAVDEVSKTEQETCHASAAR